MKPIMKLISYRLMHAGCIFFVLIISLVSNNCFAACARSGSIFDDKSISTSTASLPKNIIIESRSYNAGDIIYSSGWQAGSNNKLTISGCGGNYQVGFFYLNSPQIDSGAGTTIMPTNIPGLGVRVSTQDQAGPYDSQMTIDNDWHAGDGGSSHTLTNSQYLIELVALGGQISSGQLTFGSPVAQVDFRESTSHTAKGDVASNLELSNANVVMKAMGCTVDTSAINFPFGTINVTEFDSNIKVGSTPNQIVNLSCEPGSNVSLSVRAAEATGDNANHTVIALTGAGTEGVASGLGVQLGLKTSSYDSENNGIPLNNSISLITSTRSNGTVTNGGAAAQELLTFSATYYKTSETVTTGTANATATLTLTYN